MFSFPRSLLALCRVSLEPRDQDPAREGLSGVSSICSAVVWTDPSTT